jgi:sugar phosphate permease
MKKRHQVLLVLSILSTITFLDRIAISTAGERISNDLGLSAVQWGWILGTFTLAYGIFEVPTGLLGDRLGAKKLLIRVVLWWSVFTVLTGFSTGFVMLLAVRFLFGIGEAGAYPNISIALSKWFPAFERGQAQALIWASSRIGAGLTPLLVIPIQQNFGWQTSFYVLGAVGLIWVIFWYFWYKEEPSQANDISKEELQYILENRQLEDHTPKQSVWQMLNHKNLWFLLTMYYCYASGAYFFQSWMPKYLQKGRGISEEDLKFMSSVPFILGAVGCFLGGVLSDWAVKKYGKKWGRRLIPMIGLGLSGISLISAALITNNTLAVILLSVGLATMDVTAPVAWAVAMDIGGKNSGTISGAMNSAGLIGAYINTVSFGYLATTWGYFFPVMIIGLLLVIGSILWLKIDANYTVSSSQ